MKDEPGNGDSPPKDVIKKDESPAKDAVKRDDASLSEDSIDLTTLPGNQITMAGNHNSMPGIYNNMPGNRNTMPGNQTGSDGSVAVAPTAPIAPMTSCVDHKPVATQPATPRPLRSLQLIADDPTRTHRTWYPKYGRVQKCDYCNGRSEGTLHVCSDCHVRICQHCARAQKWDTDSSRHFIDVDACDWVVRKTVNLTTKTAAALRKKNKTRGSKRRAPSSTSGGASAPPSRRRKTKKQESSENEDDDSANDGEDLSQSRPEAIARPTAGLRPAPLRPRREEDPRPVAQPSTSYHGHNENPGHEHQTAAHGNIAPPDEMEPSTRRRRGWIHVNLPAARPRPRMREAASRAVLGMSEHSRYNDNEEEEDDDDYDDRRNDNRVVADTGKKKGSGKNISDPFGRRANHTAENPGAEGFSRAGAEAPLATEPPQFGGPRVTYSFAPPGLTPDWERDVLVLDIHEWTYGSRPYLNPNRVRTQIPNRWVGDWQNRDMRHLDNHPPAPIHGQSYHGESQLRGPMSTFTLRPEYPPAPLAQYTNTPAAYNNNNPHGPVDQHAQQQQQHPLHRQTVDDMMEAWNHNPTVGRLVAENRRLYALGLLWDVFGLRRDRVHVPDESQTVHWFVAERDRIVRMEVGPRQQGVQAPVREQQREQQQGWEEEYGYGHGHGHEYGQGQGHGYGYALSMAGEGYGHGHGQGMGMGMMMPGEGYGHGHDGYGGGGRAETVSRSASAERGNDRAALRPMDAVVLVGGEEEMEQEEGVEEE